MPESETILHATCVDVDGAAVLITGASGSGKSALALRLIALGGMLVADDRTRIVREGDAIVARAPDAIRGLIEARRVGLLRLETAGAAPVSLVIDLDTREEQRLPDVHHRDILGVRLRCLHNADTDYFAAAIYLYMRGTMEPLK